MSPPLDNVSEPEASPPAALHNELSEPSAEGGFDYDAIKNDEDRAFLQNAEAEILSIRKRTSREIGLILLEAKPRLRGHFHVWYLSMRISSSSAARYMADAKAFTPEQFATVAKLDANTRVQLAHVKDQAARDGIVEQIKDGTLTTPDAVRAEALKERAEEPKKTRSKSAAAKVVQLDAARDRKKLASQADEMVVILREDLKPERFAKFRRLYMRTPPAKFLTALEKAIPSVTDEAAE